MNFTMPKWLLPMWLLRRIVRRNPWMLGEGNSVSRTATLDLWIIQIEAQNVIALTPETRANPTLRRP